MRSLPAAVLALSLLAVSALGAAPPNKPNDREWGLITADYTWIETLRKAQPQPPANASRKQMLEIVLENQKKLEPAYVPFLDKVKEYYERTHDPRAAQVLAREKILTGDQYLQYLSRYDKALELYRAAAELDPNSADARQRIELAQQRRFVSMTGFAAVKSGMKEDDVRRLVGLPREDWIKQVVQNSRVYSVWIYPKEDGGASAVYFDNGVVYHTNWNAAAPAQAQAQTK
jgi:tetratricopeptide (TPR) repeat protein